jgi:sugar lactone lactonase YvrE
MERRTIGIEGAPLRPALRVLLFVSVIAGALAAPGNAAAAPHDDVADWVFGQDGDFTTGFCNDGLSGGRDATTLCGSDSVAVDAAGNVYISDDGNKRVLGYATPLTTDFVADLVFGQPDFATRVPCQFTEPPPTSLYCSPGAITVDAAGNLYVPDMAYSRVLQYDSPFTTDTVADRVFAVPGGTAAAAVAPDGTLYVTRRNDSVQGYLSPLTTDTVADLTIVHGGSSTPQLWIRGLAVDSDGTLYVSDGAAGRRVFAYNDPFATDTLPDRVFGHGAVYTNTSCNAGGYSMSSLCFGGPLAITSDGGLLVGDSSNNRVLLYEDPLSDLTADLEFGHIGPISVGTCSYIGIISAATLCGPLGAAVDAQGNVYVADDNDSRVVVYESPLTCEDPLDCDQDGVPDDDDNCKRVANPEQEDQDAAPSWPWIADGNVPDGLYTGGDACDADDDNDGAYDHLELGSQNGCGDRDPASPWDVFDVPVPALQASNTTGLRNRAVALSDISAILFYIGSVNGGAPNARGVDYDDDLNTNGVEDGAEYDRSASTFPGQPWRAGPPNNAISLTDAGIALAQVGANCLLQLS